MSGIRPIKPTRILMDEVKKKIQAGNELPHGVSMPVLRREGGKWQLSVFIFFFTRNDLLAGKIDRPLLWALIDIESGEILQEIKCREKDFCRNRIRKRRFDIRHDGPNMTPEILRKLYSMMDSVRSSVVNGDFNEDLYRKYLEKILRTVPESYRVFYKEMSI